MLLNNQWIKEGIKQDIKNYLETNENENIAFQNAWDAAKGVLRGKFIAIQAYLKEREISQMNNLTLHLKKLEKGEQMKPKENRKKERSMIRAEINQEFKKTIEKIN